MQLPPVNPQFPPYLTCRPQMVLVALVCQKKKCTTESAQPGSTYRQSKKPNCGKEDDSGTASSAGIQEECEKCCIGEQIDT